MFTRPGNIKFLFLACLLCLFLVIKAGIAQATALSTGTVKIDWDTLSVSHTSGSTDSFTIYENTSFFPEFINSESYAEAYTDIIPYSYVDEEAYGWTDTNAEIIDILNAYAHGWTTATELGATVEATADGINNLYANSYASAYRLGGIVVHDAGTITISVNYSIDQSLTTNTLFDYAYGWAIADLKFVNLSASADNVAYTDFENEMEVFDGEDYTENFSGAFELSMYFGANDVGYFDSLIDYEAETFAAPVPEPGTMFLLGSGLIGIIGLRKKKLKFNRN